MPFAKEPQIAAQLAEVFTFRECPGFSQWLTRSWESIEGCRNEGTRSCPEAASSESGASRL
jgi:hypothetical protein